jgi:putative restriction endonuclease
MSIYVGVTDTDWFSQLSGMNADEVNFWKPGGGGFAALPVGGLFLFKLKFPINAIVGGGFFLRFMRCPLSFAWEAFGEKNGVRDRVEFRKRILRLRHAGPTNELDPDVGCIVLANPFYFPEEKWILAPSDWSKNVVQGKSYPLTSPAGAKLWADVTSRLSGQPLLLREGGADRARYADVMSRMRLGQGGFRVVVTEAYERRCAMTGERTLPALEAAHIRPYGEDGPHRLENGLLLRADLHKLFDDGYLTITETLNIEVSGEIRERFSNGRDYYKLHGNSLAVVPNRIFEQPAKEFLRWHNENRFMASNL